MPQSDYQVGVNVQRATRTKDLAGGKTISSWTTVASGLTATLHHYSFQSQFRHEQAPGGPGSGPGVLTQTKTFFKFVPPFPAAAVNDRVILTSAQQFGEAIIYPIGTAFSVLFVRAYLRTMQLDVELVN